jgi:hypothetical protein
MGKHLSDAFPIQNSLKQDALSPLLFKVVSEYVIRNAPENRQELELNGTHQLLPIYADDLNLL